MLTVPFDAQREQQLGTAANHRDGPARAARRPLIDSCEIVDSFEDLFRRDFAQVARMAYLMLGSTGEAEEVAQEAFTELFRRWGAVDNPSGFVRTTVLNRCRDIGRRRRVRDRVLRRVRPVDEAAVEDTSMSQEVIEALAGLELPLREVAVLRFYGDHTVDEIAMLTAVPAGTVKSRLHRAMRLLDQALRPR
ncbi:MAG TPA: sigma-70 family RNA polymerase sigma factor [Microthrixaceae bacterium]|nr:sigma-70 family RNA polymerase sigma factor [Microthrixaceae bacterium]